MSKDRAVRGYWGILFAVGLNLTLVYGQDSPNSSMATPEDHLKRESLVRPCTPKEFATGSSAEASRLFEADRPTFSWCEAVDVPWLPNSTILRFHTPIDVDYSLTFSIVRAASDSPLRLIAAGGEGMVQTPSPSRPESLSAMNELLRAAQPKVNDSQLGSASILYLLLVGLENRSSFFRKPENRHSVGEADYQLRYQKEPKSRIVALTTRTGGWKLIFSCQGDSLRLDSVAANQD